MGRLAEVTGDFDAPLVGLLDEALAVRVKKAISAEQAAEWARGVVRAREHWVSDFGGAQFSLGRAWYTHLEQHRTGDYFRDPAGSDALVERYCPGLQDAMRGLVARSVGASVVARPGWCGPGVHVFPAGALVANKGGDVHYDSEGLTPAHARERAPALTIVLMLQPPVSGGGLRVWDLRYEGTDAYEDEDLDCANVIVPYEIGDLVFLDSYRMHQIQPFSGSIDRISATCHAAFVAGQWESWF